ncbi:NAD+ synthetase [Flexistipes sinusarabici DSM 4947]|uniref:NH(3)-dependent NAD(+) synthetase n=1 Tax=Flexistipes sinusarabici (strain ATCC 49648 / DSM 4947 / MAS 10) TaxID=717231 RepID=F8E6A6_FLESM|nr:NAD(+) synthase [Flexistipes sinusarabici]AEI15873.1 NAD+ synthetase [Flexistipes sinusarabici DSM 4947]
MKDEIIDFIKTCVEKYEYEGAVIGISGGLDSAVTAKLAADALGKTRVLGLLMPERDSARETLNDAEEVCDFIGIERIVKPVTKGLKAIGVYGLEHSTRFVPRKIQELYVKKRIESTEGDVYLKDLRNEGDEDFRKGLAYYRAKHRMRMVCLYLEAEKRNYAVLGATNRTEYETGFFVKWGDDSSDIEPILHLYKKQVYELAEQIGIPEKIRNKPPSPDLIPGVTDEQMLKMSYEELDSILSAIDRGENLSNFDTVKVDRVKKLKNNTAKRKVKNLSLLNR